MATAHGKSAQVLLDGYDLTPYFTQFKVEPSISVHDSTVFNLNSKTKQLGIKDAKASGVGFNDDTATVGSFDVIKSQYGSGAPPTTPGAILFAPQGLGVGNRTIQLYTWEVSLEIDSIITDLEKLSFAADAEEDGVDFGVSLHALGAETSLPFTGTAVDNAASTANGGVGQVHVTAIAGASKNAVYLIEHSTDNSSWVTLITFSAITAANSIRRTEVAAGTTVRRYLRTSISDGGTTSSVTGAVSFARR